MQRLEKLVMNSLYGFQIRKYNSESNFFKSKTWTKTEYNENVLDY